MNFDDLDKMFSDMIRRIPEQKAELMDRVGDVMHEQVVNNIQSRVGTSSEKNEKDKLLDGVQIKVGSGKGYVAVKPDYSVSKLHHLIENGHRIVRNGVVVGFVNGKHNYRDAIIQCESKIIKLAEDMVKEVVKGG